MREQAFSTAASTSSKRSASASRVRVQSHPPGDIRDAHKIHAVDLARRALHLRRAYRAIKSSQSENLFHIFLRRSAPAWYFGLSARSHMRDFAPESAFTLLSYAELSFYRSPSAPLARAHRHTSALFPADCAARVLFSPLSPALIATREIFSPPTAPRECSFPALARAHRHAKVPLTALACPRRHTGVLFAPLSFERLVY